MDRLQILIFSFYREEPFIQLALLPLRSCPMRWTKGAIQIDCFSHEHFAQVRALIEFVIRPFAELGIGREIVLLVPGSLKRSFPINTSLKSDISA